MSYMRKDGVYEAIQFIGTNRDDICKFLACDKDSAKLYVNQDSAQDCYLSIVSPKLNLGIVSYSNWIAVNKAFTSYKIYSDKDFNDIFKKL